MELRDKNILVTGGAGFIGSNLVDRIAEENPNNLIVVDSFFLGTENNLTEAKRKFPEIKIYRVNAANLGVMLQIAKVEKIDVLFDLATVPLPTSLTFPTWTIENNIGLVTTSCELVRQGYVGTLLYCSSSEALGSALYAPMDEDHPLNPCTPYAASKTAGEHIVMSYLRTYNIDTVIVRPFNNFGPRQNKGSYAGVIPIVISRVERNIPIEIFGDGEQSRDFIFVKSTAEAMIRIIQNENTRGKTINVASGKETTINALVDLIAQIMGKPDFPRFHSDPRPGEVLRLCGSAKLLKEMTGFEAKSIEPETVAETIDWYLKNE